MGKFARLDTTVTVIDAFTIYNDFNTADLLSSRRDDVTSEDERTVSDLMVDQIEFADVIILNKTDMVDEASLKETKALVRTLNREAGILEARYGKVNVKDLVNTRLFSLDKAQTSSGWMRDLHELMLREVSWFQYSSALGTDDEGSLMSCSAGKRKDRNHPQDGDRRVQRA